MISLIFAKMQFFIFIFTKEGLFNPADNPNFAPSIKTPFNLNFNAL